MGLCGADTPFGPCKQETIWNDACGLHQGDDSYEEYMMKDWNKYKATGELPPDLLKELERQHGVDPYYNPAFNVSDTGTVEATDYEEIGRSLGALITEKQKAYGDSFHKSGEVMNQLFPDGVSPENYVDVLAIVRVVDKLFRIATDPNYGGESPWKDIAGYAMLRLGDKEQQDK